MSVLVVIHIYVLMIVPGRKPSDKQAIIGFRIGIYSRRFTAES